MNEEIIKSFLIAGGGAVVGIIGTIATKFADGYLKIFFDEIRRKAKHKRDVVKEVLIITNEASSSNYSEPPRSPEHINSVLTDIDGVDEVMGIVMNKFVSLWALLVFNTNKNDNGKEDNKYIYEMFKEIEEKRKILKAWGLRNR